MKIFHLFIFFLIFSFNGTSQTLGSNCTNPIPKPCTAANGIQNTPSFASNLLQYTGNDYGCLSSGPADSLKLKNAQWLYFETDVSGAITFNLNVTGVSIWDPFAYVLYGPFSDYTDMISNCGSLGSASAPIHACNDSTWSGSGISLIPTGTNQHFLLLVTSELPPYTVNIGPPSSTGPLLVDNCFNGHHLFGNTFLDYNQNGIQELGEHSFYSATTSPNISPSQTAGNMQVNSNGQFYLNASAPPTTYTVTGPIVTNFAYSTPSSYSISLNANNIISDTLNFGIYPSGTSSSFTQAFTAPLNTIHCINGGNLRTVISNTGTQILAGISVALTLNNDVTFQSANYNAPNYASGPIIEDSIVNNVVYFTLDSLLQFQDGFLSYKLNTTSSTPTVLNSTVSAEVNAVDDLGSTLVSFDTIDLAITCSYDPNNKLVFPNGTVSTEDIALTDNLEYVVNFQNTGSGAAVNVRIEDSISPNLDFNSFQLLSSSHQVTAMIDYDNTTINFMYLNINLPDSASDPAGSQGFVKYAIDLMPNLLPKTEIANNAGIYFDLNPPIFTNTTINLVECYDNPNISLTFNEATKELTVDNSSLFNYQWFYNGSLIPNENNFNITVSAGGTYTVTVTDIYGCEFSTDLFVGFLGIEKDLDEDLKIYPIPATDRLAIELYDHTIMDLNLLDAAGRKVKTAENIGLNKVIIDLSNLNSGIYLLQIININNNQLNRKIVIE